MILCSVLCSCQKASHVSTAEDRAALFDYILAKTMEREAFSPIKNEILNLHIKAGMLRFKDEMIAANTDEKLFNVLMKISNARKDRHLSVGLVDGGLELPGMIISHAPIRFAADYGTPEAYFFFVSDYAKNILEYTGENQPEIGDKLTAVNGQPIAEYFDVKEPYRRYSTTNGLWWKFAEALPQQTYRIPSTLKENTLQCTLEKKDGVQYTIELPYFDPENIDWQGFYQGFGDERYPGFSKVYSCQTYVLHKHDHGQKVLVLDWYGFRENLVAPIWTGWWNMLQSITCLITQSSGTVPAAGAALKVLMHCKGFLQNLLRLPLAMSESVISQASLFEIDKNVSCAKMSPTTASPKPLMTVPGSWTGWKAMSLKP